MNEPADEASDTELLADLRQLWQLADPMPSDLPDRVLFALEVEQLEVDFELLRLVSVTQDELSVRSAITDVHTVTFSGPSITVMMRVSETGLGRRQIDGWLAPTMPLTVDVHHRKGSVGAEVDERGRFVVHDLPAGLTRLVLRPVHEPHARPFVTPTVEI